MNKANGKKQFKFRGKSALLTDFEIRVLQATAKIMNGKTKTYMQLAAEIGKPRACRAVANALAKNPLAPQIPCHRVIRSGGTPGGYSGKGGKRGKLVLLKKEHIVLKSEKTC